MKDRYFCTPKIDEEAVKAKREKELEAEKEKVKKEYEEKQRKKKEKEEKDKKDKDKDDKKKEEKKDDKDDDAEKKVGCRAAIWLWALTDLADENRKTTRVTRKRPRRRSPGPLS